MIVRSEQSLDDEVDGMHGLQWRFRLEHVNAVDARRAVYRLGRYQWSLQRFGTSRVNRHVLPAGDVAHHARIALRERERNVAGNRCYAEQFQLVR